MLSGDPFLMARFSIRPGTVLALIFGIIILFWASIQYDRMFRSLLSSSSLSSSFFSSS